jgi:hypothetical protein
MNTKKKSRRCRGLGLDSGLDLAISRFIYSFVFAEYPPQFLKYFFSPIPAFPARIGFIYVKTRGRKSHTLAPKKSLDLWSVLLFEYGKQQRRKGMSSSQINFGVDSI